MQAPFPEIDPNTILFCGDPHGSFSQINAVAARLKPAAMVLLGDHDLAEPLDHALAVALRHTQLFWIPGNHDFDTEAQYDYLHGSPLADSILHSRVREITGLRLAGLGGTFQGGIWHPDAEDSNPRFPDRATYLATIDPASQWRNGLPLRSRGAMWFEDYEALWGQSADVLITHEAPGCHPLGFEALNELAEAMGARLIVHGHHHVHYIDRCGNGVRVYGVGQAAVVNLTGDVIVEGIDAAGKQRRLEAQRRRAGLGRKTWSA